MKAKPETKQDSKLNKTIANLEKTYGPNVVIRLGEQPHMAVESFSSGSILLDNALGVGGFPRGRIIEIYGPESSGKTTLSLHAIAEMQKKGGLCAFIDAEHALDIEYAKGIGINTDDLYVAQPENGEQALEIADSLINSGDIALIVIDSVAALVPRAEIEGDMGDPQMALQARLMSQALRKITGSVSKSKTTLIFINQLRMKVGSFYGPQETTTGGNALKFYSTIRLDVRKIETLKKGDTPYGNKLRVRIVKNKVAPPFKSIETTLIFGKGISRIHEIIELGVHLEIIKKSGSWFSYNDKRLAQGVENVRSELEADTSLYDAIFNDIQAKINPKPPTTSASTKTPAPPKNTKSAQTNTDTATKSTKPAEHKPSWLKE
ncbi:protein RecA [Spirochaetota bacterium]|nr:protein RecA [Spirochaetota bacterium]